MELGHSCEFPTNMLAQAAEPYLAGESLSVCQGVDSGKYIHDSKRPGQERI